MNLPIEVQKDSGIPIYIQVREQIRLLIHRGILKPGDPIPTVRDMAVSLGINSNTVTRIYHDLEHEELLDLRRGLGTFVARGAATRATEIKDLRRIEDKVRQLIGLAHESEMSAVELYQLIETQWKAVERGPKLKRSDPPESPNPEKGVQQ
jgi:GntR family transcriptional regulator